MQDYLPFLQSSDAKAFPYFTHINATPLYFRRVSLANELLDLGQQQQQQHQWWFVMWSRADVRVVLDGQYCRRDHHYRLATEEPFRFQRKRIHGELRDVWFERRACSALTSFVLGSETFHVPGKNEKTSKISLESFIFSTQPKCETATCPNNCIKNVCINAGNEILTLYPFGFKTILYV
jgi:hypothetical protein